MSKNSTYVFDLVFETAALDLGLPVSVVEKVFTKGQVQFTARKIAEGSLDTIMWPYLGKFQPKMKRIWSIENNIATREIRKVTKRAKNGTT